MKINVVQKLTPDFESAWNHFLDNHPASNIFQSPYFYKLIAASTQTKPVLISVSKDNDTLNALMLGQISYVYDGVLKSVTSRSVIQGGPLLESSESEMLHPILDTFNQISSKDAIFTEIRNLVSTSTVQKIYLNHKYKFFEHLNIIIDLKKSEDELWKDVDSKRRNEIRRARREGTEFRENTTSESLEKCYRILEEVYSRARLPLPGIEFFMNALKLNTPRYGLKIFTAIHENNIIGTMFALYFKQKLYDWYAGAYRAYYKMYPNDLIPWEVFLWGKENGFETFDFGGAGKPGIPYGVRDYKKKFGGSMVNYGRYINIHHPLMMKMSEIGFKIWRKFKS